MIHVSFFSPPQWSSWLLFLSIGLKNTAISVCPFFVVVWKVCYWIHKSVFLFTGIILKTVNYCFWFDLDNTKHLQQITYNQKKKPQPSPKVLCSIWWFTSNTNFTFYFLHYIPHIPTLDSCFVLLATFVLWNESFCAESTGGCETPAWRLNCSIKSREKYQK